MNVAKAAGVLVGAVLPFMLTGCDALSVIHSELTAASREQDYKEYSNRLRLQSGDKLKISVFGEDKLTGEYEIDIDGRVSLPLAGTVQAAGITKAELERSLAKKFSSGNYIKDPKVTVDVAAFHPFYVLGEVEKPGEYAYRGGLNVLSAIAVAGGNTYRANRSVVQIQRAGESDFKEYPMEPNVPVYPGDLIRVRERYF